MSDSAGEKAAGCAVILAGVGVLAAVGSVIRGMVLTKLWAWFIVPTFSLPPLSVGAAVGLCLVVGFIHPLDTSGLKKDEDHSIFSTILNSIVLAPIITLIMGKLVQYFLM